MTKFVVASFPDEHKASEGAHALKELHHEGVISVYETIVVEREKGGKLTMKHRDRHLDRRLVGVDAVLGGLFGALAGPFAAAVGFAAGTVIGRVHGYVHSRVSEEFLDDVANELEPGSYGVLAEISEQWTAPLDERMEKLGSHLLRESRHDVIEEVLEKRMEQRCEWAKQKHAERARAKPGLEKRLGKDFENAQKKVERTADEARKRLEEAEDEYHAMMETLKEQEKHAKPDEKKRIDARMREHHEECERRKEKLQRSLDLAEETLAQVKGA
jgi:uncharacterized membrane protein